MPRSWRPLGALSEALGAENKYLGMLLSALTALSEPKTLRLEPQERLVKPDIVVGLETTKL